MILAHTRGGDGVDDGAAGNGASVTIKNSGPVTLTSENDPGSIGNLISALSISGDGDTDNDNYKSSGGNGAWGGAVTINNTGTLTVESVAAAQGRGMSGILGWSQGGKGGNQNDGVVGDQQGGTGGNGNTIRITNNGQVNLGSESSLLNGLDYTWGIVGKSLGGQGGDDNGSGGTGGAIDILNGASAPGRAPINIYSNSSGSVRGIYALSQGANGTASYDSTDNGGNGARGSTILVDTYSDITVVNTADVSELSGGIVAINQGGNGGTGYGSSDGGVGGDASNDTMTLSVEGATVSTSGDDVMGVVGLTRGGRGGDGKDGEKDSSGGRGGGGSQIQINVGGGTIETNGSYAYGVLGGSIGGQGGNGGDDTAIVGTSGGGGYGGNAGSVGAYMTGGSEITTSGDFSAAVTLHSIGGGGGTGGDFTDVLGGSGGNGGNGGNGGKAIITNVDGAITTAGDHSYGLLVQSIGGSGGTGGITNGLTLELGGDGGNGGSAETANAQNAGAIRTSGYSAHGILAQSISGGGGAAGTAGGILSIGGSGGDSNPSGDAMVSNSGDISTGGDAAVGIMVQSVGGGGGTGGGAKGIVTVGGQGSAGGNAAHASAILTGGSITTLGEMAHAIMAQSIGGGGGNGGNVIDMSVGVPAIGVGGTASGGGSGGWACVTNKNAGGDCSAGSDAPQAVAISTSGSGALGILAQSVGGGGGNGGNATGAAAGIASFQVGGGGGGGGYANTVNVGFQGLTMTTQGSHAAGIVAQSVGGGGGTGGSASSYSADIGFTASVAVGGTGASGGAGGKVFVDLTDSTIKTGQDGGDVTDAIGVLAQSISGGGGSGGSSVADALTVAIPTSEGVSLAMSVTTAVGGSGGSSHNADAVSLSLDGSTTVATKGTSSHGLVAQSIGGGGGNGGSASSMASTAGIEDTVSADIGVSVGGAGAGGGNGGAVTVALSDSASVATADDYANAIVAQSIGGGGGNGGVGSVNSKQIGGGFNLTANIGVGGAGSGGANGGTANVDLDDGTSVQTTGSGSRGVLVQSIGGGGGTSQGASVGLSASDSIAGGGGEDGGSGAFSASVGVGLGRTGGSGGSAGTVNVTTAGKINTFGADADGVLAQSIGGGGGLGGSVGQATSDDSESHDDSGESDCSSDDGDGESGYCFSVSVGASIDDGGAGGTAADGNTVELTHAGVVTTTGDWADGIVAQSIGGGGGSGGTSTASGSQATANITVGVGGRGGAGGSGGKVNVTFDDNGDGNSIITSGFSAYGALLQSIGGGGGQGGDGSDQATGKITVGAAAGGSGGSGGDGGTVSAGGWINLTTNGDDAHGLVAQSIGGGGGIGGAGSSKAADDDDSHQIDLVVGGAGSAGGSGGRVDLDLGTWLITYGDRAFGVVAQSIGGGGGIGGAGEADSIASLVVGGSAGGVINGGDVSVDITTKSGLYTRGLAAHGVIAQSIGGGGGIGGSASGAPLSFKGDDAGSYGDGGDVAVTLDNAHIETDGDHSFGVIAQSIGGGGGFGGNGSSAFMGSNKNASTVGRSGQVTVNVINDGSVRANGEDSVAIFAQSDSRQTNGGVEVNIAGTVVGGSGSQGAGMVVAGGTDQGDRANTVTVNEGGSLSAASGVAIRYHGSDNSNNDNPNAGGLAITNESLGRIDGSIEAYDVDGNLLSRSQGTGTAMLSKAIFAAPYAAVSAVPAHPVTVLNKEGGTLTGATRYQADVTNEGRLDVGHPGRSDTLTVAGDFAQSDSGDTHAAVDFAGNEGDLMAIDGATTLDGTLTLEPLSILNGAEMTILTAEEGIVGRFDDDASELFTFEHVVTENRYTVAVSGETLSDARHGLNEQQENVADYLGDVFRAGDINTAEAMAALEIAARDGGYREALSKLSPGASLAAESASFELARNRFSTVLDCSAHAGAWSDSQNCLQILGSGQYIDQGGGDDAFGYDGHVDTVGLAGATMLNSDWRIGGAIGYESADFDGEDGYGAAEGETVFAGISVTRTIGPITLAAAGVVSRGNFDTTRQPGLTAGADTARGDHDVTSVATRLRASYRTDFGSSYVTPMMDLDVIWTDSEGYTEDGAGELALEVDDSEQTAFVATPAIEAGHNFTLDNGADLRVYSRVGVSLSSLDHYRTSARFAGTDPAAGSFDSDVAMPDVVGRISAGAEILSSQNLGLGVRYDGAFGSDLTNHVGSLSLIYRF
ncbi:autotransporter [Pseudomonas sp. M30-35]|nr:autotransporter [Pseudomonas sp. M30-35]